MSSPAGATTQNGAFSQQLPDQNKQALNFESLTNTLYPTATSLPSVNPATSAYNYSLNQGYIPSGDYYLNNYLTGGGEVTPAMTEALGGAGGAAGYGVSSLFPQQAAGASNLYGAVNANQGYGSQIFSDIYSPLYAQQVKATQNNPYLSDALSGSRQAANYGYRYGAGGANAADSLYSAAGNILNTGFDPQSRIYNQGLQQTTDAANAANAMSGLSNTPYGASVAANALSNYNTNWQNNLLNRQTQATSAAGNAAAGGLALGTGAANLQNAAAAMPYNTQQGYINNILSALRSQSTAGVQAGAGTTELLGALGSGYTSAGNLGQAAATGLATNTALPYTTGSLIGSNALTSLSDQQKLLGGEANIGLGAYAPEQSLANQYGSYLNLGQLASTNTAQIGNLGYNQLASGVGGTISGISGLNSLLGGGSGIGSLIGSTGGIATSGALDSSLYPIGSAFDVSGGGSSGVLGALTTAGSLGG